MAKTLKALATFIGAIGFLSAPAMATDVIVNGGFESGFSGWAASATNASNGGCDVGWTVGTGASATGCSNVASPIGTRAAYNSFDGDGPQSFYLSQSFAVGSVGSATLSWLDAFNGDYVGAARIFRINLIGASQTTVYSYTLPTSVSQFTFTSHTLDISGALQGFSGQTVSLQFEAFIPEYYTGPAGMGLDNVSLDIAAPGVPEPATWAMLMLGFGLVGRSLRGRRLLAKPILS